MYTKQLTIGRSRDGVEIEIDAKTVLPAPLQDAKDVSERDQVRLTLSTKTKGKLKELTATKPSLGMAHPAKLR